MSSYPNSTSKIVPRARIGWSRRQHLSINIHPTLAKSMSMKAGDKWSATVSEDGRFVHFYKDDVRGNKLREHTGQLSWGANSFCACWEYSFRLTDLPSVIGEEKITFDMWRVLTGKPPHDFREAMERGRKKVKGKSEGSVKKSQGANLIDEYFAQEAPVDSPPSAPTVQPPVAAPVVAAWTKTEDDEDIVEPFGEIWIIPRTAMPAMRTVLKLKGGKIG